MSSPRLRRLKADHETLLARFRNLRQVEVESSQGSPPEKYVIRFKTKGLEMLEDGRIVERTEHRAEINLTSAYPRQAPQCRMLTPIFHPNFDRVAICIGDHWGASESLADLVGRIGQMITYQSYNIKSPLNGEAARWAEQNSQLFPLEKTDFYPAEEIRKDEPLRTTVEPEPAGAPVRKRCANCWAEGEEAELTSVGNDYYCTDCISACACCGKPALVGQELCPECAGENSRFVAAVKDALATCDFEEAQERIDVFREDNAENASVREMQGLLENKKARIHELMRNLNEALSGKQFYAALEIIGRIEQEGFSHPKILERKPRVQKHVKGVDDALADLDLRIQISPRKTLEELKGALEQCPDHSQGIEGLRKVQQHLDLLEKKYRKAFHVTEVLLNLPGISSYTLAALRTEVLGLRAVCSSLGIGCTTLQRAETRIEVEEKHFLEKMACAAASRKHRYFFFVGGFLFLLGVCSCWELSVLSSIPTVTGEPPEIAGGYGPGLVLLSVLLIVIGIVCGVKAISAFAERKRVLRDCGIALNKSSTQSVNGGAKEY